MKVKELIKKLAISVCVVSMLVPSLAQVNAKADEVIIESEVAEEIADETIAEDIIEEVMEEDVIADSESITETVIEDDTTIDILDDENLEEEESNEIVDIVTDSIEDDAVKEQAETQDMDDAEAVEARAEDADDYDVLEDSIVSDEALEAVEEGATTDPVVIDFTDYILPTSYPTGWFNNACRDAYNKYGKNGQKVVINIPKDTYELDGTIYVYSNTTLKFASGTVIKRSAGNTHIMIMNADDKAGAVTKTDRVSGGYTSAHDIIIDGGIWDATKDGGGTEEEDYTNAIYFGHAKNITIKNLTAMNCSGVHLIELTGCQYATVSNCKLNTFKPAGSSLTAEELTKEAIQLDFTTEETSGAFYPYDKTTCDNITIKGCTIDSYPCGVGQHTRMGDKTHTNIKITNNTFTNIDYRAIHLLDMKKVTVSGNTITVKTTGDARPIYAENATGTISNNTINGSTGNAIDINGSVCDFTVSGNTIKDAKMTGVRIREKAWVDVKNNIISNCKIGGIYYTNGAHGTIDGNEVKECDFCQISLDSGAYGIVSNNKLSSTITNCLIFDSVVKNTSVTGNIISRSPQYPVLIRGCQNMTVASNTISNYSLYGIYLREGNDGKRSANVQITDNTVTSGGTNGISVRNSDGTTIARNTVSGTKDLDIYVAATCKQTACYDNKASKIGNYDMSVNDGWFKNSDGSWSYYLGGKPVVGWKKIDGAWYHFDPKGKMQVDGWYKVDGKWYYFHKNGNMAIGWLNNGGKWYYLNTGGDMVIGWTKIGNAWYYFNTGGDMAVGWNKIGTKWYYLNPNGDMAIGWRKIGTKWYYLNSGGDMAVGWIKVKTAEYYLYSDGHMATNTWIGKYYVDANGVYIPGKVK